MSSRTRIVCLHEGCQGRSIDPLFINALLKALAPPWIRPWKGSNVIRLVGGGGRTELIQKMPDELRRCLAIGSDTTLMVWADLDDDKPNGPALKEEFWQTAHNAGISKAEFEAVVFIFAKDRLENWIEYLESGATDESKEAPRVNPPARAAKAAKILADRCHSGAKCPPLPPSLAWSCDNWHLLKKRMSV